jgi:hypothetical protein
MRWDWYKVWKAGRGWR